MQDRHDIVPDKAQGDGQEHTVLDHHKQRFHLGEAVGVFLGDRLVQKRYQDQERADHDQIGHIKNTVHQQGM